MAAVRLEAVHEECHRGIEPALGEVLERAAVVVLASHRRVFEFLENPLDAGEGIGPSFQIHAGQGYERIVQRRPDVDHETQFPLRQRAFNPRVPESLVDGPGQHLARIVDSVEVVVHQPMTPGGRADRIIRGCRRGRPFREGASRLRGGRRAVRLAGEQRGHGAW